MQFDLHPEKVVFNRTGVSGIKFFLWDCQFGRFFNTGPIKGKGDVTFFLTTMMWAFAPWAIAGLTTLFINGKNIVKKIPLKEYVTFFGFTIMFIVFSVSKFQLPHYLNIIYPFLAILVADFIIGSISNPKLTLVTKISINIYASFYVVVMIVLESFFRPDYLFISLILIVCSLFLIIFMNFSKITNRYNHLILGVLSTMLFALFMNLSFYPTLLKYQAGAKSAMYVNKEYPQYNVIATGLDDWLLDYYLKCKLTRIESISELDKLRTEPNTLIYTDDNFLKSMRENNLDYTVLKAFDYFHSTRLNSKFLNHMTRESSIGKRYLIKIDNDH